MCSPLPKTLGSCEKTGWCNLYREIAKTSQITSIYLYLFITIILVEAAVDKIILFPSSVDIMIADDLKCI